MAESEAAYAKETAAYAKVIARAWSDPDFKAQLLADPNTALAAMNAPVPNLTIRVVENTDQVTYLVVPLRSAETGHSDEALEKAAEQCFCMRPDAKVVARAWADPAFKAQLLADPHAALAAMGVPVTPGITVKVLEATEQVVYFILPVYPTPTQLSDDVLQTAAAGHVCHWIVNTGPQPHH